MKQARGKSSLRALGGLCGGRRRICDSCGGDGIRYPSSYISSLINTNGDEDNELSAK